MVLYGYFKSFAQEFFTFASKFAHLTSQIQTQRKQIGRRGELSGQIPLEARTLARGVTQSFSGAPFHRLRIPSIINMFATPPAQSASVAPGTSIR